MKFPITRLLRPAGVEEFLAVAALAGALVLSLVAAPLAHEVKVGDLTLQHPWARATPPGAKVAGGFTVIVNGGIEGDRLIGGSASFADRVEVHEMAMDKDVMRMRQLAEGLEIPAGGTVELKPGSYHVMFMGLKRPLAEGDKVEGTLVFEKAGSVDVVWAVEGMAGRADAHGHDMSHGKDAPHGSGN